MHVTNSEERKASLKVDGSLIRLADAARRIKRRRLSRAEITPNKPDRNFQPRSHVVKITSEVFNPREVDLFWLFVYERQNIWERRVKEGKGPPWTTDPVLLRARFTNVYRELDPGTQYLRKLILEAAAPDKDKIFNVMIYRLIGRTRTYRALGFQFLDRFDYHELIRTLKHIRDVDQKPVFSSAYLVSGYVGMGSRDKIENIGLLLDKLRSNFDDLYSRILAARTAEGVYHALRGAYGFGVFLAFQILVDLTYSIRQRDDTSILPFSNDEWAIAGPGAKRGISVLIRDRIRVNDLELMRWLRMNQKREFLRLGLDFPYLVDRNGDQIEISLSNIENCLCEFHKYLKLLRGNGKTRRRFFPIYSESLAQWISDSYSDRGPNDFNTK